MVYSSESAKWKAYQFLDPFAANSFLVCNKTCKRFCRPDCDAFPVSETKTEIEFVDDCTQALKLGYLPCDQCDPSLAPHIDVNLLIQTVNDVNASIGFTLPASDESDEGELSRKLSTLSTGAAGILKNNLEHNRLVDLACRHLALAAAISIMNPQLSLNANLPSSDDGVSDSGKKKRKRRGGVLGFKELAAKSKLSAWHFHRVFKSVTGMTPKTYGDMCWEYLHDEAPSSISSSSLNLLLALKANSASSVSTMHSPNMARKRGWDEVKEESPEVTPLPKRQLAGAFHTPHMPPAMVNPAFTLDETEIPPAGDFSTSRAFSDTDLTMQLPAKTQFGSVPDFEKPYSLFGQQKPIFYGRDDSMALPAMSEMAHQQPEGSFDYHYDSAGSMAPQGLMNPPELQFSEMPELMASNNANSFCTDVLAGAGTDFDVGLEEDFLKMEPDASDINEVFNLGLSTELLTSNVGL